MRYQLLVSVCTAAALSLSIPAPAFAESPGDLEQPRSAAFAQSPWRVEETRSAALRWEISFLALSAIDTAQTLRCLDRGYCEERNPLMGSHPSSKKLILAKVGFGVAHFALFNYLNRRNPRAALRLAQISCGFQGTAVALNARFTFK